MFVPNSQMTLQKAKGLKRRKHGTPSVNDKSPFAPIFRENFIRLDIYMADLNYVSIDEEESYTLSCLLGKLKQPFSNFLRLKILHSLTPISVVWIIFVLHAARMNLAQA